MIHENNNGFIQVQGPFDANEIIFTNLEDYNIKHFRVQTLADQTINIALVINKNLIKEVSFKIGSTGILEFDDVQIKYIKFNQKQSDNTLIDILLI
jgi:hypothetical protein